MKPRITIAFAKDGQLELWLNELGRDVLVREMQALSTENDHFHFQPEMFEGQVPTQSRGYRESDQVVEWGKVLFRPDAWDASHFPHVLDDAAPKHTDADYYGMFMSGLFGLIDSAELSGYSAEATALLNQACEIFRSEHQARHPNAWKPRGRSSPQDSD